MAEAIKSRRNSPLTNENTVLVGASEYMALLVSSSASSSVSPKDIASGERGKRATNESTRNTGLNFFHSPLKPSNCHSRPVRFSR